MLKNKSHKRVRFYRVNPLSVSLALVIALMWLCTPPDYDDVYVAEPEVFMQPIVVEVEPTPEQKIQQYFPRSWKTMIAIAHAESQMNPKAKGWNCYYNKDETIVYSTRVKGAHSTACKPSHRNLAYSVDCNILQRNVKGQVCPEQTLDEHLQEVAELSRVQGLSAWSAYNNKSYLKYLNN